MRYYIKCKTKIKIILSNLIYKSTVIKSAARDRNLLINLRSLYLNHFHRNRGDFTNI